MILTGKGGAFASPSSTDIIVVMDRSVSITGTLTNQMEKCIDKLIDNLSTRRMKIYGGVSAGSGNVGTGNYLFDPYVDDNTNGGPEGFSSDVAELKEAVDYIIANATSGVNNDYYWHLRSVQLVAASQSASDPLEWQDSVKLFGNRFIVYVTDGDSTINASDSVTVANTFSAYYVSPVVVSIENTPINPYWSDLISTGNWSGLGGSTFGFNISETDFTSLVSWITGLPV